MFDAQSHPPVMVLSSGRPAPLLVAAETHSITLGNAGPTQSIFFCLVRHRPAHNPHWRPSPTHILFSLPSSSRLPSPVPPVLALSPLSPTLHRLPRAAHYVVPLTSNRPVHITVNCKCLGSFWCDSPSLPFTRWKRCSLHQWRLLEKTCEGLLLRQRREWDMSSQTRLPEGTASTFRLQRYLEMSTTHQSGSEEPDLLPKSR